MLQQWRSICSLWVVNLCLITKIHPHSITHRYKHTDTHLSLRPITHSVYWLSGWQWRVNQGPPATGDWLEHWSKKSLPNSLQSDLSSYKGEEGRGTETYSSVFHTWAVRVVCLTLWIVLLSHTNTFIRFISVLSKSTCWTQKWNSSFRWWILQYLL